MIKSKIEKATILPGCSVMAPMEPTVPQPTSVKNGKPTDSPKQTSATSNRFGEINAYVDFSMATLSRAEALTWLVLWRDTKNGIARTGMADIGRRIGTSKRTVVTAIKSLSAKGLIAQIYCGGMNRGVSAYRVQPLDQPPSNG